jgi:hypothetical protein
MRIDHVVADLELNVRKRFGINVDQVLFRLLCDGVLLFPARGVIPLAVCD